ncbi:MAG TPA: hypothetical protein VEC16_03355 [Alphaproteobacteria bacterium]|nr:hypothetical protein [Alphaproteobacteria bacterium]
MAEKYKEYKSAERYDIIVLLNGFFSVLLFMIIILYNKTGWLIYTAAFVYLIVTLYLVMVREIFKRRSIPNIKIAKNHFILIDPKTKKERIIKKKDIKKSFLKNVLADKTLRIILKDPLYHIKQDIKNNNVVEANIFLNLFVYILLRRKMNITLKDFLSKDKKVILANCIKFSKLSDEDRICDIVLAITYYSNHKELIKDLEPFIISKPS